MKLWDVVKTIGAKAIKEVVPGGGLLIDTVNALLPHDKQLGSKATGSDMEAAIESLPPDVKAQLYAKKFDVQIEDTRQKAETVRAMLAAEAGSQHTTRPYIAKHSFHVLALVTVAIVFGWLVAVFKSDEPLANIMSGWTFVIALLVPFVALLRAYFGMLSREHKNRLDSAHGATNPAGLSGLLSVILRRK